MASSTEICNLALAHLGQEPIITLDDSSKFSRLCKRFYSPVFEGLLRAHAWSFAINRTVLAQRAGRPAFGEENIFALPTDCIRVVEVNTSGLRYTIEKNNILTQAHSVELRYVQTVDNENLLDQSFIDAFALKMAVEMCYSGTSNLDMLNVLTKRFTQAITEARHNQAIEAFPQQVIEGPWALSRY